MTFQDFRIAFQSYPVISVIEIEKLFPGFDRKNLAYWQAKNRIQKIRNGWYRLTEKPLDSEVLFFISNQIYQPSYVSLETALSVYGFIPEGVFKITSVSTLKTQQFQTSIGHFSYQNIRENLFFGYQMRPVGLSFYKIADPEKALLDFFYLNPSLNSDSHFEGLRLNFLEIKRSVDFKKWGQYLNLIQSASLNRRAKTFQKFIEKQTFAHA